MPTITRNSHPKLYRAFEIIHKDVQQHMPIPDIPEELTLDAAYDADRCERALAPLSDEELREFAVGEEEFRFDMIEKHGDDLEYCDAVLTEQFVGTA